MKNMQIVSKEYLQNVGNHLQLVVERLTALANGYGLQIEMSQQINELVMLAHVINQTIQKYEQLEEFYVVGDDMINLENLSALQKFLENEVN